MIHQIQTILRKENLSASQLAEKLGIQRSSISHILSERNKPSLDFIQKLLDNFPHLSSDWILTGKGNYSKQQESKKQEPISTPNITPPNTNEIPFEMQKNNLEPTELTMPSIDKSSYLAINNNPTIKPNTETRKKTIRIVTFYNDNTFDEFFPNKTDQ